MKMDWWRACWRSKSGSGKGNETSQSQASSRSKYNKAGGRVTLWREKHGRVSRRPGTATAWHPELSGRSSHPPEKEKEKTKIR